MLRNPVDRAYSQYQMSSNMTGSSASFGQQYYLETSFQEAIEEELHKINKSGITPNSTYEEFISKLVETVPKSHGYHSLLARGLYYFQLMPYLAQWPKSQFKIVSTKDIEGSTENVQRVVNEIFTFLKLPTMETIDVAPRHIGQYHVPMNEHLRHRLEAFFKPYNDKLFELIGKELNW
jgi:hypothetical protein